MKKFLFFLLALAALFFTSCTKSTISTDVSIGTVENEVHDRNSVAIDGTVNLTETDVENGIITFSSFDDALSGLTIAPVQTLEFTDGTGVTIYIAVDVVSFGIIILEEVFEFSSPNTDLTGLEISQTQTLVFEE